jgi:hypothetical protein
VAREWKTWGPSFLVSAAEPERTETKAPQKGTWDREKRVRSPLGAQLKIGHTCVPSKLYNQATGDRYSLDKLVAFIRLKILGPEMRYSNSKKFHPSTYIPLAFRSITTSGSLFPKRRDKDTNIIKL